MKILLLCNKVPYPANDGSSIAIKSMVEGFLQNGANVSLLSLNTLKHFKEREKIQQSAPKDLELTTVKANTNIHPIGVLSNLLSNKAYHVSRFFTEEYAKALKNLLSDQEFDVIQIEGLSMAVYIPLIRSYSKAKISFRAHNAEYQIWERTLEGEKNFFKKQYLKLQVKRLKKFEQSSLDKIDALVPITDNDLKTLNELGYSGKHKTIPCGVNLDLYDPVPNNNPKYDIGYLASFDWPPNQQGLYWFMENVWPTVLAKRPETTFCIAGRRMPDSIANMKAEGFHNIGEVEDMAEFIKSSKVNIVPLLAGSGMRIKIVENMALGRPMVSTTIGAEGIELETQKEIVLEDDGKAFADAIINLLGDSKKASVMGAAARAKAEKNYSNKDLGKSLLNFYSKEVC